MQFTQLKCPSCGSPFRDGDFNAQRGVATCSYCKALMTVQGGSPASHSASPKERQEVPLPEKLKVARTEAGIEIRRRWFQPLYVFLLFFCIAWDGFLVFWYTAASAGAGSLLMWIFPIGHVAVGLGLSYFTLAGFLNTTTITIGRRELSVRHRPLPWRGSSRVETSRIDQLYCKKKTHRGKHGETYSYDVILVLRDQQTRKLVSGLPDEEQALFLEQQIERTLGLADRPIPGELPR